MHKIISYSLIISICAAVAGCNMPQNGQPNLDTEITVEYNMADCTYDPSNPSAKDYWKPYPTRGKKGTIVELAKDENVGWRSSYVKTPDNKDIIGWCKDYNGNTCDYALGETITLENNLILYPAYGKNTYTINYDLSSCTYSDYKYRDSWQIASTKVKYGASYYCSGPNYPGNWSPIYVSPTNGKRFIGWSKNKDGSSLDIAFDQKITPSSDLTLYPAYTKYGVGDDIDGNVIFYVKDNYISSETVKTDYFMDGKETTFKVSGEKWQYIALNINATQASSATNFTNNDFLHIYGSDDIGSGKANTDLALQHADSFPAAKQARTISDSGNIPSSGEIYLIMRAIKSGLISGVPTTTQTTHDNTLGNLAYFWSSSSVTPSTNPDTMKIINLCKDACINLEVEQKATIDTYAGIAKIYISPIVYYDKDGIIIN